MVGEMVLVGGMGATQLSERPHRSTAAAGSRARCRLLLLFLDPPPLREPAFADRGSVHVVTGGPPDLECEHGEERSSNPDDHELCVHAYSIGNNRAPAQSAAVRMDTVMAPEAMTERGS